MDAKTKRKRELKKQIEKRRDDICHAAFEEFLISGIENAKISDIAKRAEVGAATVYRYFENKPGLVIYTASKMWGNEINNNVFYMCEQGGSDKNGFSLVKELLSHFAELYDTHPEFLRLLEEFDNYVVKEKIPKNLLNNYETIISKTESAFLYALEKGRRDGSIRSDINAKTIQITATHAITSLCQKFLLRGDILESDSEINPHEQINCLIDMELSYIQLNK